MSKIHDLTGQKFGRLTVLSKSSKRGPHGEMFWKCLCDCGNLTEVRSDSLLGGSTKSCGCLRKEFSSNCHFKHGMCKVPTYFTWQSMIQRCENPKNRAFKNYGGRGIKICSRWHKFENFLEDMGKKPSGMSLDRIDNDGSYELRNCRWATPHEQRINSRPISTGRRRQKWFRAWQSGMMCQFLSNNQSKFARDHSLCSANISHCLNGKEKSHKGWTFKFCPGPDHLYQESEFSNQHPQG